MPSGMHTKTFPGNETKIDWSAHEGVDQFMKEAWDAGASARRVAQLVAEKYKISPSRNAVIGRLSRTGVIKSKDANDSARASSRPKIANNPRTIRRHPGTHQQPSHPTDKVHAARIAAAPATLKKIEQAPLIAPDQTQHVAYADLGEHDCSWPISGSGMQMMCCGGKQARLPSGRRAPYCAFHMNAQKQGAK